MDIIASDALKGAKRGHMDKAKVKVSVYSPVSHRAQN